MNFIQHEFEYDGTIKNSQKELFTEGDVIVPDTHPDILSVYQLDGSAVITDITPSDGKITLFGKVILSVIYKPESDTEILKSIKTKLDFNCRIDDPGINTQTKYLLECDVSDIDFQLINSRKIRLKSKIKIDYTLKNPQKILLPLDTADEGSLNSVRDTVSVNNVLQAIYPIFEVNESFNIAPGQSGAAEILKSDMEISEAEYKCVGGKIILKCMCVVTVLYKDTAGDFSIAETQIPISEICELNSTDEDVNALLRFTPGDVNCVITNNSDGEPNIISVSAEIYSGIIITKQSTCEYICDCYISGTNTEPIFSDTALTQSYGCEKKQLTLREMLTVPQGYPPINRICKVSAKPVVNKLICSDGKCTVSGNIIVFVSYLTSDTTHQLCCFSRNVPFEDTIDCSQKADVCRANASVIHCSYIINSSGNIDIRILLEIDAEVQRSRKLRVIESLEEKPAKQQDKGIKIYFTSPEETLWDIGKKFLVSTDSLKKYNPDAENEKIDKIIIPLL